MGKFFPGERISSIHGKPQKMVWQGLDVVVIPMYHPAAALYRGNLRPVLLADFQKILKVLALITQGSPVNEEEDQKEAVSHQKQAALF